MVKLVYETAAVASFAKGDKVTVLLEDGKWYGAVVTAVKGDSLSVQYSDGSKEILSPKVNSIRKSGKSQKKGTENKAGVRSDREEAQFVRGHQVGDLSYHNGFEELTVIREHAGYSVAMIGKLQAATGYNVKEGI